MKLTITEIVMGSLATCLVGGVMILLGSKLVTFEDQPWKAPRVIVCLAAGFGALLTWIAYLLETIWQREATNSDSNSSLAYGLMIIVFGYIGALKRLAAWSRMERSRVFQRLISWMLIGLAMIGSITSLFMNLLSNQPLSFISQIGALFGVSILSDLVIWFFLLLSGRRLGMSTTTIILEIFNLGILITYVVVAILRKTSDSSMYIIYLSCGILELAVITEYAHPQAFQDESLKLIPSRSLSDHLRVREKETRQDKYLSIRLDPENLSEFASQIFKEVELSVRSGFVSRETPSPVRTNPPVSHFKEMSSYEWIRTSSIVKSPFDSSGSEDESAVNRLQTGKSLHTRTSQSGTDLSIVSHLVDHMHTFKREPSNVKGVDDSGFLVSPSDSSLSRDGTFQAVLPSLPLRAYNACDQCTS